MNMCCFLNYALHSQKHTRTHAHTHAHACAHTYITIRQSYVENYKKYIKQTQNDVRIQKESLNPGGAVVLVTCFICVYVLLCANSQAICPC